MLVLSVILVVGYGIDVVMIIFCCGCCKLLAHSEKKNSYLILSYYTAVRSWTVTLFDPDL